MGLNFYYQDNRYKRYEEAEGKLTMNNNVIIVAETGSDVTPELAAEYSIYLVPMHVQMGNETFDDGTFPPEDVCAYFERTGDVPRTSASTPYDFEKVFDEIHEKYPDKHILHLAYSAITTCSYQNAVVVSEDRDYVTSFDTKHVSVGQGAVVLEVAKYINENPDVTVEEALRFAEKTAQRTEMCFVPKTLNYLKAGGRVSNAAALLGNILNLHPCIEIIDGKLMAEKKYRGSLKKVVIKLMRDFDEKHQLNKEHLYLISTPHMEEEVKEAAESSANALGFKKITWMKTGCVITSHSGAGAFGMVGVSDK